MKRFSSLLLALSLVFLSVARAQIAPHVMRSKIAGVDVLIYPTGVKDVVTIHGSLPAGDALAGEGNIAVPTLTGMLLDKGTTAHDQFALAGELERVGATISFNVGNEMLEINAKCLKKDASLVISLIAEQLRTPAFAAEELAKMKKQFAGGLQRQLESTDFRAVDAFSRAVYPEGHPNRQPTTEELLAAIDSAKLSDIQAFHKKFYGPAHLTFVIVGDVDAPQLKTELAKSFTGWTGGEPALRPAKAVATDAPKFESVFMADKTSVSVVLGQTTGLRYSDPDYQALRLATSVLGGSGFSGRLMQTVRDKEGLTYGIYSNTSNDTFTDGDWKITATFAPALLTKGLASTREQLAKWYDKGISEAELDYRKTNLVGSFKVSLSTTDGMAASLLAAIHRGYDQTWLDRYPRVIESLTLDQVNGAVKKHLNPENMVLIEAGTIPGAAPAVK
ncbi:MAG TPA: pitrilysin family protein [Lacunisphaera sp.]|jgi:zinc protease